MHKGYRGSSILIPLSRMGVRGSDIWPRNGHSICQCCSSWFFSGSKETCQVAAIVDSAAALPQCHGEKKTLWMLLETFQLPTLEIILQVGSQGTRFDCKSHMSLAKEQENPRRTQLLILAYENVSNQQDLRICHAPAEASRIGLRFPTSRRILTGPNVASSFSPQSYSAKPGEDALQRIRKKCWNFWRETWKALHLQGKPLGL